MMREALRGRLPELVISAAFALLIAVGFTWGLPGSDTWCADSISPRACGLGAIAETYWPGHFHTYPPLHMALLTVLSLPWMALALARVGPHRDALGAELVEPLYMTGIEVTSRLVTAAMALAIVWNTMRLWRRLAGRRVALGAGIVLLGDATFVYYAHTGNLDVPYMFWASWALLEIDRVFAGEPREVHALVLATCAVLTKDQAAAALILPVALYVVVGPRVLRRAPVVRPALVRGALFSLAIYAVASGALVNPIGFEHRIAFVFGPASQPWAGYSATATGRLALLRDMVRALPHFGSWPLALLAVTGVVLAFSSADRARLLLPFVSALSFTWLFNLSARRSEDRFLLPQSLLLLPYAALAIERARTALERRRATSARRTMPPDTATVVGMAALVPGLLGVVSLLATLVFDTRYAAEAFLAKFPKGTRVEIYGTPKFLPRLPAALTAVRPGVDPPSERVAIPGVVDQVDPEMDPGPRAPDLIVLATELSRTDLPPLPAGPSDRPIAAYRDPASRRFFHRLMDGELGYTRVLDARCSLPWPLACHHVHGSTGEDLWIYAPAHSRP
jgi:hypothetical protein